MTALRDFAQGLVARHRAKVLQDRSRPWTPSLTPATDLGYECERRIVYHRVKPDAAKPVNEGLALLFEEGNLHQRDVRAKLAELGAEVLEAERNFRDERLEITGTIDGRLEVPNGDGRPRRVPLEIKSTSGAPPADEAAWRASESSLLRRYYAQLTAYMFLANEPEGILLCKGKQGGEWTMVAVELDYEYAEGLLKRAERVRDAVRAWKAASDDAAREAALPARIADRSECDGGPWRETGCHPADAPVDPLLMAVDAELVGQLDRRAELDPSRREFEKLDERVKARFKLTAGDRFVVGERWLVQKKKHGVGVRVDFSLLPGAVAPSLSLLRESLKESRGLVEDAAASGREMVTPAASELATRLTAHAPRGARYRCDPSGVEWLGPLACFSCGRDGQEYSTSTGTRP